MSHPSPTADTSSKTGPMPACDGQEGLAFYGLCVMRTLVMDGDAVSRRLPVEAVGNRRHQATGARSIKEAVALLAQHSPDCLFVNYRQEWPIPLKSFLHTFGGVARPAPMWLRSTSTRPRPGPPIRRRAGWTTSS